MLYNYVIISYIYEAVTYVIWIIVTLDIFKVQK